MTGIMEEAANAAGVDGDSELIERVREELRPAFVTIIADALHEGSRSTRIERVVDTLFAVVNDVTFDFAFEASDVATLLVTASGAGSRLVNLSILTSLTSATDSFTFGVVVGGAGVAAGVGVQFGEREVDEGHLGEFMI